jgi:preprotein translocase subunit SecD
MKTVRALGRIVIPFSLVFLAACQTVPGTKTAESPATTAAETVGSPQEQTQAAQQQGAPVAVFMADTVQQTGWTPVNLESGALYVNPQPIITRTDLAGIKAGTNKQGDGLLALELNEAGKQKVADATAKSPNKRLALVVGRTMMAAPAYTTAVTSGHLVFAVGTEQNAMAAARAIAGAPDDTSNSGSTTTPAASPTGAAPSAVTQ